VVEEKRADVWCVYMIDLVLNERCGQEFEPGEKDPNACAGCGCLRR
jgi:hypothetical protein